MESRAFVYEYTLFFLYAYSFMLLNTTSAYTGWWILMATQFIATAYFLSYGLFRGTEPTFFILFAGMALTLSSLGMVMTKLPNYQKQDPSVNVPRQILMVPMNQQVILNLLIKILIANLALIFFVFIVFRTEVSKYISPILSNRKADYHVAGLYFVQSSHFTYFFTEYLVSWLSGLSQLAILGLSSYMIVLAKDFT